MVALGGGHGLSTLLRGLKACTNDLAAIVTVADDGGSSGILRETLGLLPPGDIRNCIVALAEAEPLMKQLFQYRFGRGTGLDGHAFGNLFIAALAEVTGSFEGALTAASRVLAVKGRILPASLQDVELYAEVHSPLDGSVATVRGQSHIAQACGVVERVYLQPGDARGYPGAISALLSADLIVIGPGSLYTSVLPSLLIGDIASATAASPALKVYVCNVATQPGETDGYTLAQHVAALSEHLGKGFCQQVLANANLAFDLPASSRSALVVPEWDAACGHQLTLCDLIDGGLPWRHDSAKLAAALMRIYKVWANQGQESS
jgi:uncharacterized cofD-like protein